MRAIKLVFLIVYLSIIAFYQWLILLQSELVLWAKSWGGKCKFYALTAAEKRGFHRGTIYQKPSAICIASAWMLKNVVTHLSWRFHSITPSTHLLGKCTSLFWMCCAACQKLNSWNCWPRPNNPLAEPHRTTWRSALAGFALHFCWHFYQIRKCSPLLVFLAFCRRHFWWPVANR